MRPFGLAVLAAFCFASALAQQTQPGAPAPAPPTKATPPKDKAPAKPPAKKQAASSTKPPAGFYQRALCTLTPSADGLGTCQITGAAPTLLPHPAINLTDFTSCLNDSEHKPHPGSVQPTLSAASVAAQVKTQLVTIPAPFQLLSAGNYLYIYSTDEPLKELEKKELAGLITAIGAVAAASPGYVFELSVSHASALGSNVAASLQAIAPSGITVGTTGTASVRVSADGTISCNTLHAFLQDFDRFVNHTRSDTPVASVFFIDPAASGDATGATAIPFAASGDAALGITPPAATTSTGTGTGTGPGTGSGAGAGSGSSTGSGAGAGSNSSTGTTGSAAPPASPNPGSTPPAGTSSNASGGSNGQSITITTATASGSNAAPAQPSGSTPTGPVTTTTITTTQPASPSAPPTISATPTAPTPPASAPAFSVNGRDLLFTGGTPGDDAWITEKKRALALLDLPQPQVLVNAWMIQNSTTRADESGRLTTFLHQIVNSYNDTIQLSLFLGWSKLMQLSSQPAYFDKQFYDYLTLRTVANPSNLSLGPSVSTANSAQTNTNSFALDDKHGFCPPEQYCLGYQTLFQSTAPRLTDMLLTLLAAWDPAGKASMAIDAIENGPMPSALGHSSNPCGTGAEAPCKLPAGTLKEIRQQLWLDNSRGWAPCGCQLKDMQRLYDQASGKPGQPTQQRLPLECFRVAMQLSGNPSAYKELMRKGELSESDAIAVPTVGVERAALADFLFNYKMSQEFPHEFTPYDLTASAQTLDSALEPYIHAFNEDLQAYQTFMRAEFVAGVDTLKLTRDKNTFLNDGLITVQTTSGDLATVSTATQNYLNVSRAPSISQLLSSVTGTNPSGTNSTTGAPNPLTGVLSNLSANQAQVLVGALAAYQSTSLNVSRQLNLVVKPRSLLGAEAAEMDVQLNADQAGTPQYWNPGATGGAGSSADLSDVSQHDVTTHVRIDSIRLFDISSLTAIVSKGRDKFPLLPPFVEIPYIGTLAGIPLPAAREYHSSSAVLSAVIVPTATDIAYSLHFTYDRILLQSDAVASNPTASHWIVRKVTSMNDFGSASVREFHKLKLHCIATLDGSPYSVGMDWIKQDQMGSLQNSCVSPTYANVLRERFDY